MVGQPADGGQRFRDALREARLIEADRTDVVTTLREAELTRLDLLKDDLEDVFAAIPEGTDLLECGILRRYPPRLWIDVLAYILMGPDKRTYRFLKETRNGRQVLLETPDISVMSDAVTRYVAHRVLQRERALATDDLVETGAGGHVFDAVQRGAPQSRPATPEAIDGNSGMNDNTTGCAPIAPASRPRRVMGGLFAFILGAAVGIGGLLLMGYLMMQS